MRPIPRTRSMISDLCADARACSALNASTAASAAARHNRHCVIIRRGYTSSSHAYVNASSRVNADISVVFAVSVSASFPSSPSSSSSSSSSSASRLRARAPSSTRLNTRIFVVTATPDASLTFDGTFHTTRDLVSSNPSTEIANARTPVANRRASPSFRARRSPSVVSASATSASATASRNRRSAAIAHGSTATSSRSPSTARACKRRASARRRSRRAVRVRLVRLFIFSTSSMDIRARVVARDVVSIAVGDPGEAPSSKRRARASERARRTDASRGSPSRVLNLVRPVVDSTRRANERVDAEASAHPRRASRIDRYRTHTRATRLRSTISHPRARRRRRRGVRPNARPSRARRRVPNPPRVESPRACLKIFSPPDPTRLVP